MTQPQPVKTTICNQSHRMWQQVIQDIKQKYTEFGPFEINRLEEVYQYAFAIHRDRKRYSGQPHIQHILQVLKILLNLKPDFSTLQAILLHDADKDTEIPLEKKLNLEPKVQKLLADYQKTRGFILAEKQAPIEMIQQFFATDLDPRAVLIRIASRIHNLQTLQHVEKTKRQLIAREALLVFAPVAKRLNLYFLKDELEDLSFKFLYPQKFLEITARVEEYMEPLRADFAALQSVTEAFLRQQNLPFKQVQTRQKNIYSIYEKMVRKNYTEIEQIFDLFAVRILTDQPEECYQVLGGLHASYRPLENRLKDYIALPKTNGYQALHSTVLGLMTTGPVEVQIKTYSMHMQAEFGPASHWLYKSVQNQTMLDRQFLAVEASNEKSINLFSPQGELVALPRESVVLDYAYALSEQCGHEAVSCVVNGHPEALDYKLQDCDVVSIIRQGGHRPTKKSLRSLKTQKAQKAILNSLGIDQVTPENTSENGQFEVFHQGRMMFDYYLPDSIRPSLETKIVMIQWTESGQSQVWSATDNRLKDLDSVCVLEAQFGQKQKITIQAQDQTGMIYQILQAFSELGLFIDSHVSPSTSSDVFNVEINYFVFEPQQAQALKQKISAIEGVIDLEVSTAES